METKQVERRIDEAGAVVKKRKVLEKEEEEEEEKSGDSESLFIQSKEAPTKAIPLGSLSIDSANSVPSSERRTSEFLRSYAWNTSSHKTVKTTDQPVNRIVHRPLLFVPFSTFRMKCPSGIEKTRSKPLRETSNYDVRRGPQASKEIIHFSWLLVLLVWGSQDCYMNSTHI